MKAKSAHLTASRQKKLGAAKPANGRRKTVRLPAAERRTQILQKAFEFFSEYGLTAQTRALADACGVSQRLLYSVFPNKSALIKAVYETQIAGIFKAIWFVQLRDRSRSMEKRLNEFYREYYATVLTRQWMRLFLYASLAEEDIATTYIASLIKHLLETLIAETAVELKLQTPTDKARVQELGWILHGAVSHLAIRRHIYNDKTPLAAEKVIEIQVASFMEGARMLLKPVLVEPHPG